MKPLKPTCRLAVVQAEPKLFDKEAGLRQTLVFIRRAAARRWSGVISLTVCTLYQSATIRKTSSLGRRMVSPIHRAVSASASTFRDN